MERLHDPSTNAYGPAEHVYSLHDIDVITQTIYDDEWTALGSVIAETMFETILEVGDDALGQRGWVERMSLTNRIAEEVSSAVEKSLYKIRSQPSNTFDHGLHPLPEEVLTSLHTLLRHELGSIIGLGDDTSFDYNGRDLSLIVLSSVSDAIESYCGITNINAPFFNLSNEMEHRIRDRRRALMIKHSRGYENVKDVEKDILKARKEWMREVLGNRAALNYEFGEVTTKAGNEHSHEKEKRTREGRKSSMLNALFQDLDGALMP
eukprot:CAMPEP_0201954082 /NCGR_PEP_ID=MMETSP0904-20121228/2188_1 /ASSEMBLY_ACC=CAM_ASM_000553 /TAXON_ID=420261 /ORGANISM="Thalassiosira antarctica, Strain CCMP982" /LENGTH=263 /DNA_ID=CAMNT_0048498037 /DNA_START=171 /DNA_END=965 /DNA_ORIENTATION=-